MTSPPRFDVLDVAAVTAAAALTIIAAACFGWAWQHHNDTPTVPRRGRR